jgi:GT2 family glycosyltransferase
MRYPVNRPSVSIAIANYNYARFLPTSIDSALSQTYPDVEVIVVDDVSVDRSREVIASYGDRIKPCFRHRNGGHAAAFNTGFEASSGDIVFFLDADDFLYPQAVSEVVEAFRMDTAMVQFRLHLVDENREVVDVFPAPEFPFESGDVVPQLLEKGRYQTTVTSGLAFRRSALEAIMPIPEEEFRQGADGYLVTTAPFHGIVRSIDECLGAYRQHGGNHSAFDDELAKRARWRVDHDFRRFEALENEAAAEGLTVPEDIGLRDPLHVEERLASLCTDAARHPVRGDSRLRLGAAGAAASMGTNVALRRRAVLAAWFLSVGILPRHQAKAVLSWKLMASSRPQFLARGSKMVRRFMG